MSTYIRLVCTDHEPHLVAESESGQHLSDLSQIRADIRDRDRIVANVRDDIWPSEYFRRNTAMFLSRHPRCTLAIEDEYGESHPIREES